jgi:hypothetical protein
MIAPVYASKVIRRASTLTHLQILLRASISIFEQEDLILAMWIIIIPGNFPMEVHRMACGKCAPKGGEKDKKKDEKKKK